MNKKEALKVLMEELEGYLVEGFRFHKYFIEEFKVLLAKASGHEKEIFILLVKQLNFVAVLGRQVHKSDGNEIIKYQRKTYYSLHLCGKNFNIRLLMTFDEKGNPLFLAAFYERAGKQATNYTEYTSVLDKRYEEMCGEDDKYEY